MEKRRANVVEYKNHLVLVNDENEPIDDELFGLRAWALNNQILRAASPDDVEDQTDSPHTAGLTVVRRDADGWYVRYAECLGGEPGTLAVAESGPCAGTGPEVLAERIGGDFGPETTHACNTCQNQDSLDR